MPVRKLKPVEANDGSYAGLVLAAFDKLEAADNLSLGQQLAEKGQLIAQNTGTQSVRIVNCDNPDGPVVCKRCRVVLDYREDAACCEDFDCPLQEPV